MNAMRRLAIFFRGSVLSLFLVASGGSGRTSWSSAPSHEMAVITSLG